MATPDGVYVGGSTSQEYLGPASGNADVWVAMFDADGNLEWGEQFGTNMNDYVRSASQDGQGGVYFAGESFGELTGPIPCNCRDAWAARYDVGGNQQWLRPYWTLMQGVSVIAEDGEGGSYVLGTVCGESCNGYYDGRIARLSPTGDVRWVREVATQETLFFKAALPDGVGGVIFAADNWGSLYGPGAGDYDFLVGRLSAEGNLLWGDHFGFAARERLTGLVKQPDGGLVLAGHSDGDFGAPSLGLIDGIIVAYSERCQPDLTGSALPGQPGYGVPDGIVNSDDFFYYLTLFTESIGCGAPGTPCTSPPDFTSTSLPGTPGYGVADGILQNDDFFYFLTLYAAGC
ncbi:MAG: GC-type dockerin domain-anchored protein [Phycisphaerales bacterium]